MGIGCDDDDRDGYDAEQACDRGQGDRQRHVTSGEGRQDVRRYAARCGGDDHQSERQFPRHRPDRHYCESDQREKHHLGYRADEEVAWTADHPDEIVDGEADAEREHDEGEREWQENVDDKSQRNLRE